MVVAKLRVVVEDPVVARERGFKPETILSDDEPFFLDGPVAARIAIVDRESDGSLASPVRWLARSRRYRSGAGMDTREAIAVNAFGIALRTLSMFERPDVLGHRVQWAFGSPQLLIVPRAGEWENAFYDRYSRSLQFFFFRGRPLDAGGQARRRREQLVHTALSREIVAHETAHAVLDGLAPALYDAVSPQSLALHESVGDLAALLMSLASRQMRAQLVKENEGRLDGSTPTSQLALQFGQGRFGENRPLRDAANERTMGEAGNEPHDLSEVLTGAVWKSMSAFHKYGLERAKQDPFRRRESLLARTLSISALQIGRIVFRALDYIPPAETSFADFAKALIRADEVVFPREGKFRDVMKEEFLKRGIVRSLRELGNKPDREYLSVDIEDLLASDWAAYAFAERERALLAIPAGVPFRLFPRRDVRRSYWLGPKERIERREVVFQVTWEENEGNPRGVPGARRAVFRGTTLVLGERDRRGRHPVLSCLTSSLGRKDTRDEALSRLAESGGLRVLGAGEMPVDRPFGPYAFAHLTGGTLRVRGTARLLHIRGLPEDA